MALASVRYLVTSGNRIIHRFPCYKICRCPSSSICPPVVDVVVGDREVVGYGKNSASCYIDHPAIPFPAIRFREMTPDLLCLREKEKGDWRNLSMEEKKTLYRASFCQTYAEILAPTGKWKSTIGFSLIYLSIGVWFFLAFRWIWHTDLPDSYLEERQQAQLKRIITLRVNPIIGLSSKWDYKCNRWK